MVQFLFPYLIFLLAYVFSSRIISIPIGLSLLKNRFLTVSIVFGLDLLQVPFFYRLYDRGFNWLKKINLSTITNTESAQKRLEKSSLQKIAYSLGNLGVIFLAATPTLGGGMWSAVLFAHILKMPKRKSFIYLAIGSFLGCLIVVAGYQAFYSLFKLIFYLFVSES